MIGPPTRGSLLKELDLDRSDSSTSSAWPPNSRAAKAAAARGPAAVGQEHRVGVREGLDPHPLRVRGRRLRPGRPRHLYRPEGSHLGRDESVPTPPAYSGRMFDGIEFRGFAQDTVEELARYAGVPVWNGLTDQWHPTQMLADVLTMTEHHPGPTRRDLVLLPRRRPQQRRPLAAGHRRPAGHGRPHRRTRGARPARRRTSARRGARRRSAAVASR